MIISNITKTLCLGTLFLASFLPSLAQADPLFSLENLERERAAYISTQTDATLTSDERSRKAEGIYRRMVDIERMVLRDERIAETDNALVKKAFANYDLTFLIHASAEQNVQPFNHWLNTLNITNQAIQQSHVGYR